MSENTQIKTNKCLAKMYFAPGLNLFVLGFPSLISGHPADNFFYGFQQNKTDDSKNYFNFMNMAIISFSIN